MKRSVPQSYCAEPKTLRGGHQVKIWRDAGSSRGAGARKSFWVADIGWTHCASFLPGGRKACWYERALARKKLIDPSDEGREWAEGETVRVCTILKSLRVHGL